MSWPVKLGPWVKVASDRWVLRAGTVHPAAAIAPAPPGPAGDSWRWKTYDPRGDEGAKGGAPDFDTAELLAESAARNWWIERGWADQGREAALDLGYREMLSLIGDWLDRHYPEVVFLDHPAVATLRKLVCEPYRRDRKESDQKGAPCAPGLDLCFDHLRRAARGEQVLGGPYATTEDDAYLEAIDALLRACESRRRRIESAIRMESREVADPCPDS